MRVRWARGPGEQHGLAGANGIQQIFAGLDKRLLFFFVALAAMTSGL
ncbi:MAG: hypothetical protein ACREDJ_02260 [Methylocella sp.]